MFYRNTTSLFGAGLIDQISDDLIVDLAKQQKQHPEISGRPSTLKTRKIGKFGWRANVASLIEFNDQACANEVGLETRRKRQARDPMMPNYRNPTHDIEDLQIESLNKFVAMLPPPIQKIPQDSGQRIQAERGERVFAEIGCAVCHVPNVGPAMGIYSDILLHDMGDRLIDLNHAEPYRVRASYVDEIVARSVTNVVTIDNNTTGYYGSTSSMTMRSTKPVGSVPSSQRRTKRSPRVGYTFVAPVYPEKMNVIDLGEKRTTTSGPVTEQVHDASFNFRGGMRVGTVKTTTRKSKNVVSQQLIRVFYEPTKFNQEWRTPPLWGVRDSAPYMHDGRAATLLEAISIHEGESTGTRDRFLQLPLADRMAVISFLETLVAPSNVPQAGI